tara:strand:- start:925 stop:1665 length:741 start_codon:yes stop_codon:yes gene_type:complete
MIGAAEELELVKAAAAGDNRAAMKLVDSHMPLIRATARRLKGHLEEEDAIAEATFGFLRSLPRYDIDSGYRLNTYARHYIAEAVRDASSKSPLVRFSRNQKTYDGLKAVRGLAENGSPITPETIAKEAGVDERTARDILGKFLHSRSVTYAPIDEAFELVDDRPDPLEAIERQQRLALLEQALSVLTPREKHIFQSRTAANDTPLTLEELGQVYGVSRERIRQIEQKAYAKVEKRLMMMGFPRIAA